MVPEEMAKAFVKYNTCGTNSVQMLKEQLEYFLLHYGDAEVFGKDILLIKSENKIIKEAYKIANDDGLPPRIIDPKTPEEINAIKEEAQCLQDGKTVRE